MANTSLLEERESLLLDGRKPRYIFSARDRDARNEHFFTTYYPRLLKQKGMTSQVSGIISGTRLDNFRGLFGYLKNASRFGR